MMKKTIYILLLWIIICSPLFSQTSIFKGRVLDNETNTPLEAVNIYSSTKEFSAVTDKFGNFIIKNIPLGNHVFTISFIGYLTQKIPVRYKRLNNL